MPKRINKMPINLEIKRLQKIYDPEIAKLSNVTEEQKINFISLVLPSLAEPQVFNEISQLPRYICSFDNCKKEEKSFSSKQKYVQHLKIIHDQDLPGACSFLYPNDKATVPGGFWCSVCGHHYCRRDHLQNHIRTNTHCLNANICLQNPLEMKELEVEERLAIEAPNIPKSDIFNFKRKESLLAIEWNPLKCQEKEANFPNKKEKTIFNDSFKKITKSLSMISISKIKRSNLERKSKTLGNIFSLQNITFADTQHIKKKEEIKRKNEDDQFELIKTKKLMVTKNEIESDDEDQLLVNSLIKFENNKILNN